MTNLEVVFEVGVPIVCRGSFSAVGYKRLKPNIFDVGQSDR